MTNPATGQVEPDEVRCGQVAVVDSELVERNEGGTVQSVAVGSALCGEAFIEWEAIYYDKESSKWTTDIDNVEIVWLKIMWDLFDQRRSHFNKRFHTSEK